MLNCRSYGRPGDRNKDVAASVAMVHSVPELIVSEEVGVVHVYLLLSSAKLDKSVSRLADLLVLPLAQPLSDV